MTIGGGVHYSRLLQRTPTILEHHTLGLVAGIKSSPHRHGIVEGFFDTLEGGTAQAPQTSRTGVPRRLPKLQNGSFEDRSVGYFRLDHVPYVITNKCVDVATWVVGTQRIFRRLVVLRKELIFVITAVETLFAGLPACFSTYVVISSSLTSMITCK
jgi:hypothetical protein